MNLKTRCYFAFLFPSITFAWFQFASLTQSSLRSRSSQLSSSGVTRNVGLQASDDDDDEFISEQKAMFEINESESIGERSRLISESVAPWRELRLFLHGSAASGAFVGGLITLTGAIAAMNGRGLRADVDLNTEYLNLEIDFGDVFKLILMVTAWKVRLILFKEVLNSILLLLPGRRKLIRMHY